MERQESALAAEFEDRRQLLMTVPPPRLVGADGAIVSDSDRRADTTLVAVTVHQVAAGFADDTEVARALTDALGDAERPASATLPS